ncbi:MAG TPA: (deoxy)nucleoside triphosphate pyrophosphohydrolase [Vicinamibacterales bacterium]|nr:(deoxy)nucleoside triphosphate pyrophosphohydrolase [Vicinamibacterales bacterium]
MRKPDLPILVVVAGVIEHDGRFLVTRRPPGVHLEGFWEFPGGKCGPEESLEEGLRREVREELDAPVDVGPLILSTRHEYPDRIVELHFYACRLTGAARPLLGQEMRWVARGELTALPFPPADRELIAQLTGPDAPAPAGRTAAP